MRELTTKEGLIVDIENDVSLRNMSLHDSFFFDTKDGYIMSCVRVFGGWIYRSRNVNGGIDMVFVHERMNHG